MSLSTSARVGLLTWITIAAGVGGLGWLTRLGSERQGYPLRAVFSDVNGLLPGANVLLMGVRVGRVKTITPRDRDVLVDLWILDPETRVLEGSRFKILNKGIIGEKNLEIFPPSDPDARATLANGTTVNGQRPDRLDAVLEEALTTVRKVRALADSPETRQVLTDARQTVSGVRALVTRLDTLTSRVTSLVGQGGTSLAHLESRTFPAIDEAIADTRSTIDEIHNGARTIRVAVQALELQGHTGEDVRVAIGQLRSLATRLDSLAGQAEQVTRDPRVRQGIGTLLDTSRRVVAQAGAVATDSFKLSPHLQLEGVSDGTQAYLIGGGGVDARIGLQRYQIGIEQIGDGNLWTATWGRDDLLNPGVGFQVGLIRSRLGGGLSWTWNRETTVRIDLFSPQSPVARLSLSYGGENWQTRTRLMGSWLHPLDGQDTDRIFLGVQWRPLD